MGDWGDIAGGFNQGMRQNIRTIAEIQQMNLLQDKAEREKNIFEAWKRKEAENQRPIFLDNLPVNLGDNVKNKLYNIAEMRGLLNRTPDNRMFIRAKHGKELLSLINSPELLSEQMKDLTTKETELKTALSTAKKPEEQAAIQKELQGILQGKDALSMRSKEFADMLDNKKKLEILEKTANEKNVDIKHIQGQIGLKALRGEKLTDVEKAILQGKQDTFGGTSNFTYDKRTGAIKQERSSKPSKITNKIIVDPDSSTGYSYADEGGNPIAEAPKEKVIKPGKDTSRREALDVAKAEEKILSNQSKEAAGAHVDIFNRYAEKPYAYQWKKGKLYGGSWEKIKLPVINGQQATAAEIYYTAEKHGMTYDAVLNQVMQQYNTEKK